MKKQNALKGTNKPFTDLGLVDMQSCSSTPTVKTGDDMIETRHL